MKSKNHYLLLLLIGLLSGFESSAQHIITGRVTNQNGTGLAEAILVLLRGSTIVQTSFTDNAGGYSLSVDSSANYILRATLNGFEDADTSLTCTEGHSLSIDLILRPKIKSLEEVKVSRLKPLFERKPDRFIFNVANSLTATGGTALDAIKKAPGVMVREDDNTIRLIGKSQVLVMVNGRLMQLEGEDLIAWLQSIPSENIERIEVITTPPSQYEAAGNAGLLNIVLKKNILPGFNGNARMGYEQASFGKPLGGASLNYRKKRLNLYANGSCYNGANQVVERLNTDAGSNTYKLQDDYKRTKRSLQYTAGADYEVNKTDIMGLQFTGSNFKRTDLSDFNFRSFRQMSDILDSLLHTDAFQKAINNEYILNLNYVKAIDTAGKQLTLNANRLWYNGHKDKHFETQKYIDERITPIGDLIRNKNLGRQEMVITTAQADVELPYKWARLSLGGKLSFVDNNSRNSFLYYSGGSYSEDPVVSNRFLYKEHVQALYASAVKTIGKWQVQCGLRGEFTQTDGASLSLSQSHKNSYFNLFPTLFIQYTPGEDQVLNINYSKRIDRPGYNELDPFRSYSSPYSYVEGNPFLEPSINHNAELSYSYRNKYTVTGFLQYEQNHFGQVFFIDPVSGGTQVSRANFSSITGFGVTAAATINPLRWWEMLIQLNGISQRMHPYNGFYENRSFNSRFFNAVLNNSFFLNKSKTLLAEVNVYYVSRYLSEFWDTEPFGNVDAGIRLLIAKGNLTINVNGSDLLASQKFKGVHTGTGQTINNYFDTRNVRITISYKFGSNKVKAARQRTTGIEEEKSRT